MLSNFEIKGATSPMKLQKLILSVAAVICTSLCLCSAARAVDLNDERFSGKTWDEVMTDFLAEHETDASQVTAGYYNTVTGEEYYLNPDQLMYGASVAKLPTNMLYAERVYNGEMTMETLIRGNRYELLQRLSLVNSDNPAMETMVKDLGGGVYAEFRKQILPYIGLTEEEADESFLARNFFSSKQIMYTLKLLYSDPDRYPGVVDCLLQASPYDYFKGNQPPYTIAHKYGWYTDNGVQYLNDSAIVYTDDPILLVMFTGNVKEARQFLADYCSLMCDYAQYQRTLRYSNEARELTDLSVDDELTFLSVDKPETLSWEYYGYAVWQLIPLGIGCVLLIIALVLLAKKKLWSLLIMLLAAGCIVVGGGPTELAHLAVQNGDAVKIVEDFADAFHDSNSRGAKYLTDLDSAMASFDSEDVQSTVINKISDTFDLKIGKAVRSGNYVAVPVTATKVDLEAINNDLNTLWEPELEALLQTADLETLYDEDGLFVSDTMDAAHQAVLDTVLNNWDNYLVTEEATLHLTLALDGIDLTWKIVTDEAFLDLVNY